MALRDVPLPPDTPRPEMWTPEAIVQAVQDGFMFGIPFTPKKKGAKPNNAYWIGGRQYIASLFTVSPEHTPDIALMPESGWLGMTAFFQPFMVPEDAWLTPPNEYGVVPVHLEIDPDTIDWERLNRGYQFHGRGPVMGLHTPHEQTQAFAFAEAAFRAASRAQEDRDDRGEAFARGYLQGLLDLAAVEGAERLAEDVRTLMERLG